MLQEFIEKNFSKSFRRKVRNFLNDIRASFVPGNLNKLARIYKTDKWGEHFYTPHYMTHLKNYRFQRVNLLEIGVGGYDDPQAGGFSLRMWKKYFPFGKIFSLDIYDKSPLQENRIKIYKGSQVDLALLERIANDMGTIDIIIDDGSHINEHVIETFKYLFPKLKNGGVYVIEDTQTSYWEDFGGSSQDLNNPNTMMNFFKAFIDGLNHVEFIIPGYEPSYYDLHITSIHFYHNLIFIHKGLNNNPSNKVVNNITKKD
ncbi:MAG: class I SAM-dependent methyltransferase [Bacteroidia bacterium]